MGWTKQQIVEEAFGVLALAGHVFDLSPEVLQSGVRRLDMMLATWSGKGIRLGYPLPSSPDSSDLDSDSNLPDIAVETVFTNLAVRLASGYGKQLAPETLAIAKSGYDMLLGRAAMPPEVQVPSSLPLGAGNKTWRSPGGPFASPPQDSLDAGPDGAIDFN